VLRLTLGTFSLGGAAHAAQGQYDKAIPPASRLTSNTISYDAQRRRVRFTASSRWCPPVPCRPARDSRSRGPSVLGACDLDAGRQVSGLIARQARRAHRSKTIVQLLTTGPVHALQAFSAFVSIGWCIIIHYKTPLCTQGLVDMLCNAGDQRGSECLNAHWRWLLARSCFSVAPL